MSANLLQIDTEQTIEENLQKQLMSCGLLPDEYWESTWTYLQQTGVCDITHLTKNTIREYENYLRNEEVYPQKQIEKRTEVFKRIYEYWIKKEYTELFDELKAYQGIGKECIGNVKDFLIRHQIHHIREIDYSVRVKYEEELRYIRSPDMVMTYLKVLDRLKQKSILDNKDQFTIFAKDADKYKNEILFLPYYPKQELVQGYCYTRNKDELVWDFSKAVSEGLKRQVFEVLQYVLENIHTDNAKEQRVRFLLPLKWLYEFCAEQGVENLELLEEEQIDQFQKVVEQKVVNVRNSMQIIDNSRRILFLNAKEIHWHANVWYMERFHFLQTRINPSNPVKRITFLDVINREDRKILQEYAKYLLGLTDLTVGNIRAQIYNVKKFMNYFHMEKSICNITQEQVDVYLKELQNSNIKNETFNVKVTDITKFYCFLKSRKIVEKIPFSPEYYLTRTFPIHHDRSVDEDTYMEILKKIYLFPEVPRLIFIHLWCTGLRISEICTLKGDAYYWDGKDAWMKVYQIKMKTEKLIPIPNVLYCIMNLYIQKKHIHSKDYIFSASQGGAYRYGTFMKAFRYHCKKHQILGADNIFKSHDYRHTLATNFYNKGTSIQTIRDYLGHASENMTKQYIDYMPKQIAQANEEFFGKKENNLAAAITVKRGNKNERPNIPL